MIYLAIQHKSNGGFHIRRYRKDHAKVEKVFESRSVKSRDWLEKYGCPIWNGDLTQPPKGAIPYES